MRPRHYAGERGKGLGRSYFRDAASMRPRHYAGESHSLGKPPAGTAVASMRPRHYAGESRRDRRRSSPDAEGFNEAPALRRGKVGVLLKGNVDQVAASMRPRHYAGESRTVHGLEVSVIRLQ